MLRVMSFNLRYGSAPDGRHHWRHRRPLVLARIRAFAPDLLGAQECRDDEQAAELRQGLPEYDLIGVRRGTAGDAALEMAPLLYRRAAFELREHGHFWLSATPAAPGSVSWGAAFPRTVTWARLKANRSGAELTFVNTHFDHASETARTRSAEALGAWLARTPAAPVIVTGDFNAGKDSAAYRCLTGALRDTAPGRAVTFHNFGAPAAPADIDWILASPAWRVAAAGIDTYHERGLYPSDHYPVTAGLH